MLPVVAGNVDAVGRPDRRLPLGDGRGVAAAVAGRRHHAWSTPWSPLVARRRVPRRGAPLLRRARPRLPGAVPDVGRGRPMRLFHGSITYLTLLFLAVAIDPLLPF